MRPFLLSFAYKRLNYRTAIRYYHHAEQHQVDCLLDWSLDRISDPRTIVKHLNDYVIGQDRAKKMLAVAVFNHYNRVRSNMALQQQQELIEEQQQQQQQQHGEHHISPEYYDSNNAIETPSSSPSSSSSTTAATVAAASSSFNHHQYNHHISKPRWQPPTDDDTVYDKSNVMLIGPTGSGKTLLARTLAQVLSVPFSMSDATPFTQAGYVGEDVELVIQRLLQACDYDVKKAEMGIVFIDEIDKISRRMDSFSASRDVSGEGVQQSLLRMLEGTTVNVTDKSGASNGSPNKRGLPGGSIGNSQPGGAGNSIGGGGKGETYAVDTSNILFILSGAFVGLEKTIQDRMAKGSIGFDAFVKASDQEEESTTNNSPLSKVEPADLVKYGLIPEFIGRLPVIASVNNLTSNDLVRVLTEPKNSLLKQYQGLFQMNNVDLRFSHSALVKIAEIALEKKTGARGLRRILENLLLEPMYDTPVSCVKCVVIDSKVVTGEKKPIYLGKEQRYLIDKIIGEDDVREPTLMQPKAITM